MADFLTREREPPEARHIRDRIKRSERVKRASEEKQGLILRGMRDLVDRIRKDAVRNRASSRDCECMGTEV
jgi:hypothetical protein